MRCKLLIEIMFGIFLVGSVCAVSDVAVFQGQYYLEDEFQQGTFTFEFDVYDDEVAGNLVDSKVFNVTTGTWGQWKVEYEDLSEVCNDTTKDYFLEITIDNSTQTPRRRLTHFNYLRKDVDDSTTGDLTISSVLNFLLGGYIQEFVDRFVFNKGIEVVGDVNVSGNIYSDNKLVCLADGTNCIAVANGIDGIDGVNGSDGVQGIQGVPGINGTDGIDGVDGVNGTTAGQYSSFISTVDGKINKNDRYLSLGTDGGVSASSSEMSWIIDRDMIITGILWDSKSNSRTKSSAIILMGGSNKNSLSETSLTKDIQGVVSGSDLTFNVSLSQGDAVAIKYDSGGNGGDIEDLSITLIGTYD